MVTTVLGLKLKPWLVIKVLKFLETICTDHDFNFKLKTVVTNYDFGVMAIRD